MYEAGLFIRGVSEETLCSGSAQDCQQYYLEPGKLYTVTVITKGKLRGPEALYDALRKLYKDYPGVYISYIRVEPQGDGTNKIVVQLFDPPVYGLIAWWQIVAIILAIAVLIHEAQPILVHMAIALEKFAEAAKTGSEAAKKWAEQHPLASSILVIGLGALLLSSAISKAEKS